MNNKMTTFLFLIYLCVSINVFALSDEAKLLLNNLKNKDIRSNDILAEKPQEPRIIPRIYTAKDLFIASEGDLKGYKITSFDGFVIPPKFEDAWGFNEIGLAKVKIAGKYGMIDINGNFDIDPLYDEIWGFSNGLAPALKDNKWGYIDSAGKVKIPFIFDNVDVFINGIAKVYYEKKIRFINAKGKFIKAPDNDASKNYNDDYETIYIGPRGGRYVIRNGKKVYLPRRYY